MVAKSHRLALRHSGLCRSRDPRGPESMVREPGESGPVKGSSEAQAGIPGHAAKHIPLGCCHEAGQDGEKSGVNGLGIPLPSLYSLSRPVNHSKVEADGGEGNPALPQPARLEQPEVEDTQHPVGLFLFKMGSGRADVLVTPNLLFGSLFLFQPESSQGVPQAVVARNRLIKDHCQELQVPDRCISRGVLCSPAQVDPGVLSRDLPRREYLVFGEELQERPPSAFVNLRRGRGGSSVFVNEPRDNPFVKPFSTALRGSCRLDFALSPCQQPRLSHIPHIRPMVSSRLALPLAVRRSVSEPNFLRGSLFINRCHNGSTR